MSTQLRLPPDLHAELKDIADLETRSFNAQIVHVLRQWVQQYREGQTPLEVVSHPIRTTAHIIPAESEES